MVDFRILLHRKEIESDDPTISDLMFRYSLFKAINIEETNTLEDNVFIINTFT